MFENFILIIITEIFQYLITHFTDFITAIFTGFLVIISWLQYESANEAASTNTKNSLYNQLVQILISRANVCNELFNYVDHEKDLNLNPNEYSADTLIKIRNSRNYRSFMRCTNEIVISLDLLNNLLTGPFVVFKSNKQQFIKIFWTCLNTRIKSVFEHNMLNSPPNTIFSEHWDGHLINVERVKEEFGITTEILP